jgi:hypothetical protein
MWICNRLRWVVSFTGVAVLAAASAAASQAPAQREPLRFQPKLGLKWPGRPSESSQVLQTEAGDEKHYSATYTDKRSGGAVVFAAFAIEFPEKALKGTSPKELLAAYVFASKKDETSRKEVTHGPKKHPGLDITTRAAKLFRRKLVIMAGLRLYEVSVTSKDEQALKTPEVKVFFDSLAIEG